MIEDRRHRRGPDGAAGRSRTLHAVSHDPTLQALDRAARRPPDDRGAAALGLPRARRALPASSRYAGELDADTAEVMQLVGTSCSTQLERDPMERAREVDWVAKLAGARRATATATGSSGPTTGCKADRHPVVRRAPRQGPVPPAAWPPAGSRSSSPTRTTYERRRRAARPTPGPTSAGSCLEKYPDEIAAASWDSVIFDVPGHALPAAGADARAAAGHPGERRRPAGPQPGRRLAAAGVGGGNGLGSDW